MSWHHDGSALHVPNQTPSLGDTVTVFLRGPAALASSVTVHVRSTPDGEPRFDAAALDRPPASAASVASAGGEAWWRAEVPVRNRVTRYRFLILDGRSRVWVNALGTFGHDVPDDTDFRLIAHPAPPDWAEDAIVYQIFPDRFARSPAADGRAMPPWAIACDWDTPVVGRGPQTPFQVYGGDLDGIASRLDHVESLGANAIYLTPIFPARSNHRYDAASFDEVDPLLGGDKALDRLAAACRARGIRLIGDITTNHTGAGHSWFTGPESRDFYYWNADGTYESWLGVASLPKLNWASAELRRRFFSGPDAIVSRWLSAFDGWRVDVASMTGRHGADDFGHEVAALMASALREPGALLVGEHTNDASGDLDVDGYQGTMNYAGFTRPITSWLRPRASAQPDLFGQPGVAVPISGLDAVTVMRAFAARMSWRSLTHSWTLLGSHDTPRIRTLTGDRDLVEVGLAMMATYPGAPMVFMGDELGMVGENGEDARRPMPWADPGSWDQTTLRRYRALLGLRAAEPALRRGGLRFVHASADAIAYWRETATDRLLVLLRRAPGEPIRVPAPGTLHNRYGGASAAVRDGLAELPGDGPTAQIWALGD